MICFLEVDLESLEERPFRRTIPTRRSRRSASEVRVSVVERDADCAIQIPVHAAHPFLGVPGRCSDTAESVVEESTLDAEVSRTNRQLDRSPPVILRIERLPRRKSRESLFVTRKQVGRLHLPSPEW